MGIGIAQPEERSALISYAKEIVKLEVDYPGTADQIVKLVRMEIRYTGIIDQIFNLSIGDQRIASKYGLTPQAINIFRSRFGAVRSMRGLKIDELIADIDAGLGNEDLLTKYNIRPAILTIIQNRHRMGTMSDYQLGKELKVGYTLISFYRNRLKIPAWSKGK